MIRCKRCFWLVQYIHAELRANTKLAHSLTHSRTYIFNSKNISMYIFHDKSVVQLWDEVYACELCVHFLGSLALCLSNLAIFVGTFTISDVDNNKYKIIILVRVNMCRVYGFLISSYLRSRLINCFLF